MKILAYDTSSDHLTVAVFEDQKMIANFESDSFTRHSSTLAPSIEKALKESRVTLEQIDVLAVGLGPGSFTGLRVGITTAKLFGYIHQMKIVGVSSLQAIAQGASEEPYDVAVILDAKKEKLYAGLFRKKDGFAQVIQKPKLCGIETFLKGIKTPRLFLGNGTKLFREKILNTKHCSVADNAESVYPKASNIAQITLKLIEQKKFIDPLALEPLYLHRKDCNVTLRPVAGAKR